MTTSTLPDAATNLVRAVDILRVATRAGRNTGADVDRVAGAHKALRVAQVVPCPTCGAALGLLAQCDNVDCLSPAICEDIQLDRRCGDL